MNVVDNATLIGKSVKIHGDLTGSEDLVMEGELEGTIHVPGARLTLGSESRVRASVVAKDVIVLGWLEGDIRATGRVELRSSAKVQGNIFSAGLSIEENAAFRGVVDPSRAGEPLSAAPIASVASPVEPTPLRPLVTPQTARFASEAASPARPLSNLPAGLAAAVAARTAPSAEGPASQKDAPAATELERTRA